GRGARGADRPYSAPCVGPGRRAAVRQDGRAARGTCGRL
ncbi:MAG: hypothetical protein AVDCRST_MAG64-3984, partial [uncultured Phycisphaerae bacterium]